MTLRYLPPIEAPDRADIDKLPGPVLLQFGTEWCGHCRAAATPVQEALARYPQVRHIAVEDGSGRALGRSFRVKLWPTLVLLSDGQEVERLVRPTASADVQEALARLLRGG